MNRKREKPTFLGPHEGRELELMAEAKKPLSMFLYQLDDNPPPFPEEEFDSWAQKAGAKKITKDEKKTFKNNAIVVRRIFYALPGEEWRIDAFLLVQQIYDSLDPGWRPDLERAIGLLLGYDRSDIEQFIKFVSQERDNLESNKSA